jgi:hypothetical protein
MKVKFKKSDLLDLDLPWSAIEDTIVDHRRWSVDHNIIFKKDEKYYRTSYSVGATEQQDERPWEYEDEVECEEVQKVAKTITVEVWETV